MGKFLRIISIFIITIMIMFFNSDKVNALEPNFLITPEEVPIKITNFYQLPSQYHNANILVVDVGPQGDNLVYNFVFIIPTQYDYIIRDSWFTANIPDSGFPNEIYEIPIFYFLLDSTMSLPTIINFSDIQSKSSFGYYPPTNVNYLGGPMYSDASLTSVYGNQIILTPPFNPLSLFTIEYLDHITLQNKKVIGPDFSTVPGAPGNGDTYPFIYGTTESEMKARFKITCQEPYIYYDGGISTLGPIYQYYNYCLEEENEPITLSTPRLMLQMIVLEEGKSIIEWSNVNLDGDGPGIIQTPNVMRFFGIFPVIWAQIPSRLLVTLVFFASIFILLAILRFKK